MIDPENHNSITLVKCIDFADKTILLKLQISKVNILNKWYQYHDLDNYIMINITKS